MSEMVKRVASVIKVQQNCGRNDDGSERPFLCPFCHWTDAQEETGCFTIASAVIAAMREPDDDMLDAGARNSGMGFQGPIHPPTMHVLRLWRRAEWKAMIDEALK